jgi:chromosomal replication initiation ATPase DnaA
LVAVDLEVGVKRKEKAARDRARAEVAVAMAAGAMQMSPDTVVGDGRAMKVVLARQVAMYIAAVGFGMSYGRVAAALGRDRSTVQHACRVVEDRRDDPAFDRWIEALEATAAHAPVMS